MSYIQQSGFRRALLKAAAVFLLVLLASMGGVAITSAHASLVRSEPADSSVVGRPPRQVRMWFADNIAAELSTAELLDAEGQVVPGASVAFEARQPKLMILSTPAAPAGTYSVHWQVTSELDTHPVEGFIVYSVSAAGEGTGAMLSSFLDAAHLPLVALGALLGVVAIVCAAAIVGLMPTGVLREPAASSSRWRRWPLLPVCVAGLGILLLYSVALLAGVAQANDRESSKGVVAPSSRQSQVAGDLMIAMAAQPNLPGQNVFSIRTATMRRPSVGKVSDVSVQLTGPDGVSHTVASMSETLPGLYSASGVELDRPGEWRATVTVARDGLSSTTATFVWTLGASAPVGTGSLLDQIVQPILSMVVLLLGGLVLFVAFTSLPWLRAGLAQVPATPEEHSA